MKPQNESFQSNSVIDGFGQFHTVQFGPDMEYAPPTRRQPVIQSGLTYPHVFKLNFTETRLTRTLAGKLLRVLLSTPEAGWPQLVKRPLGDAAL